MWSKIKPALTVISVLMLILFGIFCFNQCLGLINSTTAIHPVFGKITLVLVTTFAALLLFFPLYYYIKLPRRISLPAEPTVDEWQVFFNKLQKRYTGHPHIETTPSANEESLRTAISELDSKAEKMVMDTASAVFVATALSQSGRLDGLLVLSAQLRMVWKLASLYNQKPLPAEIIRLYANVAGTSFIALEMEDANLEYLLEPWIDRAFSSLALEIPLARNLTAVLISSIINGAANALFTLRVGLICRKYCHPWEKADSKSVFREASALSLKLIGKVVKSNISLIFKKIPSKLLEKAGNSLNRNKDNSLKEFKVDDLLEAGGNRSVMQRIKTLFRNNRK